LLRGLGDALMMRVYSKPRASARTRVFWMPDHFQQVVSAHGTIMIFFVGMGLMFGLD
jgi:cytochrome o ubiquinol oxidase subunit 1